MRIHGLRTADLAAGTPPDVAADALLDALRGRILVAHAAWVERGFLARRSALRGARLRGGLVDTLALGRLRLLERDGVLPPPLALEALAGELGLPVHARHSARGDALTTAQVFLALAAHLDTLGGETVRLARRRQAAAREAGRLYRSANLGTDGLVAHRDRDQVEVGHREIGRADLCASQSDPRARRA